MRKITLAALSIVLLSGAALAADLGAEREKVMKSISGSLKSLSEITKGAQPYDAETVRKQADNISTNLQSFASLFEPGTEKADDSASPDIWTDRAGFEKLRLDAMDKASALGKADEAGLKQAVQNMAGTCKACHAKFRISD